MLYSKEKLDKLKHRWTTAKGKQLIKTIKRSHCYLSPTLFREKVKINTELNPPGKIKISEKIQAHLWIFNFCSNFFEYLKMSLEKIENSWGKS